MEHHSAGLLTDIGLSIIFAAACSHVFRLLRQPLILGYVLGGVLLGSHLGFGFITDEASIELISEIGLILLLFIIGLEINLRDLAKLGRAVFGLGIVQFLGCVGLGLLAVPILGLAGDGRFDSLYLAVAFALSSTLIVVKLLHDKFEISTLAGRVTVGVLVLQDLWAIVFMAMQPNMLNPEFGSVLRSVGQGAVLVLAAWAAARWLLGRIFAAAGRFPELVLLSSVAWCFGLCGLAEKAGLSKEMGALIAGMSIAAFPYGTDVIAKLSGVRDFFVTLFFVALGLKVPAPTVEGLSRAGAAVGFVVASRLATVALPARFLGVGLRAGLVTALNLSQISEFSLVILAIGAGMGHVSAPVQSLVLTSMLLASLASTYLIMFNDRLARWLLRFLTLFGLKEKGSSAEAVAESADGTRDIVLLGCFRAGEALVDAIEREAPELRERVLVVDYNPALRRKLEPRGFRWVYGDLAHPETLEHVGIEHASVIVSSISDAFLKGTSNRRLLGHLRKLAPEAKIIMTADEPGEAERMLAAGAAHAVMPTRVAGQRFFELLKDVVP